jgi:predicted Fe-Mo cluster-binding NifX family protein
LKIAIMAEGPGNADRVGFKLSTASHIVVVEEGMDDIEVMDNPGVSAQRGRGVQTVVALLSHEIGRVIVGYCSPSQCSYLQGNGIEVQTGFTGSVQEAIDKIRQGAFRQKLDARETNEKYGIDRAFLVESTRKTFAQFSALLPVLIGVVLLIGMMSVFLTKQNLSAIFTGKPLSDTLRAAFAGSVIAGNPINSYIIGKELLDYGVTLFAVTAFMLSWVTVGIIQLPAEIAAFGKKFALARNGLAFIVAIPTAIITVIIFNLVG